MEKKTPILFTLYEPETGEVKAEYATFIVPFGILETAVLMAETLDLQNLKTEDINALAALVVDLFGKRFELEDVKKYADVEDTITVMNSIMSRARAAMPKSADPTKALKAK
jgi:hypothetical protein